MPAVKPVKRFSTFFDFRPYLLVLIYLRTFSKFGVPTIIDMYSDIFKMFSDFWTDADAESASPNRYDPHYRNQPRRQTSALRTSQFLYGLKKHKEGTEDIEDSNEFNDHDDIDDSDELECVDGTGSTPPLHITPSGVEKSKEILTKFGIDIQDTYSEEDIVGILEIIKSSFEHGYFKFDPLDSPKVRGFINGTKLTYHENVLSHVVKMKLNSTNYKTRRNVEPNITELEFNVGETEQIYKTQQIKHHEVNKNKTQIEEHPKTFKWPNTYPYKPNINPIVKNEGRRVSKTLPSPIVEYKERKEVRYPKLSRTEKITCECCGSKLEERLGREIATALVQVHHIKVFHKIPDAGVAFNVDKEATVWCIPCHELMGRLLNAGVSMEQSLKETSRIMHIYMMTDI